MSHSPCRVGLVGAGTVGGGVIEVLRTRADLLARRSGARIELVRVAELDRAKAVAAGVPESLLVSDWRAVAEAPDVDVVVELIGGTGVAETIVRAALERGKPVVTANKALLAEKGRPLFELARRRKAALAFEAAVCGGIPIILALREGLVANRIRSLLGIVNGTCNYILTQMIEKGADYAEALGEAQRLGFAEANPKTDVEGIDSGHKLALLSALAFDTWIDFPKLSVEGIHRIERMDVEFARHLGYTIKLLAVARVEEERGLLFLSVHPALLRREHPLAGVQGSMNAVALEGDVVMESLFYGRGAGRNPTASAVVSDIVALARALAGALPPPFWGPAEEAAHPLGAPADARSRHYLRFLVADRPGVLGQLTTELGRNGVSIASVRQFESASSDEPVPVAILTHAAREGDIAASLAAIAAAPILRAPPVRLRIED